jgi:hypothetical protein
MVLGLVSDSYINSLLLAFVWFPFVAYFYIFVLNLVLLVGDQPYMSYGGKYQLGNAGTRFFMQLYWYLAGDWYRITLHYEGVCIKWWHLQGGFNSFKLTFQPSDTGLKKEVREMLPVVVFKESFLIRETQ